MDTGFRMKPKNRLVASKVVVLLLYGSFEWLERKADGLIQVRLGPLARAVRISSVRLRETLSHLRSLGLILEIDLAYNKALIRLRKPPTFDMGGNP